MKIHLKIKGSYYIFVAVVAEMALIAHTVVNDDISNPLLKSHGFV